ncbi:MAG TPA: radical SAM protein [Longimicrobium sp.]|nr:radical SAM protein [Longimicrobium sp.]
MIAPAQAPAGGRAEILVAHSYYLLDDPKQVEKMRPYSPLATLITAAVLRERGHGVALFDAMLAPGTDAFVRMLDDVRPRIVALVEDSFNFLTKMCTLRMRESALAMVRAAHAAGCRVVVNGSDASDHPALYLAAGADAVLLGDPESGVPELAELWLRDPGAALDGVAGLALPAEPAAAGRLTVLAGGCGLRGDATVRRTAPRAAVRDLDALPLPAWDLVDAEAYRRAWTGAHGRLSWNVVTSRGCPYGCNWCAKPLFGRRYDQRSPGDVAAEIRLLKETVAPDHLWFADDIFGLTAEWIQAFADEVARLDARTPFMMQTRVNLMRPATVAALAAAGAEEVWLGVESGSQKILDAMEKGSRVDQVRTATRTLKAHGIRACWFIQLGYLGEDWDDVLLTRDLVREERPDDIGVSVSYPLPGTKFHAAVQAQMGAKQNWSDTDDLAMLFHGTFSTAFYKQLRDVLHREARPDADRAALDLRWAELAAEAAVQVAETAAAADVADADAGDAGVADRDAGEAVLAGAAA